MDKNDRTGGKAIFPLYVINSGSIDSTPEPRQEYALSTALLLNQKIIN